MKDERRVFISYSHSDQEIARMLDASMLSNGVDTFLDAREIKVGDSIPERIYRGIDAATDLLYLISKTSVASAWVEEELSIAKVKEKTSAGFCILPILIEDVELPTSVSHIRYADLRNWKDPSGYRRAVLEILSAMGVSPRLLDRSELQWYASHSKSLRRIHRTLVVSAAALGGALTASQSIGYLNSPHAIMVKYVLEDLEIRENLRAVWLAGWC